jgi:hypothetical protein
MIYSLAGLTLAGLLQDSGGRALAGLTHESVVAGLRRKA